MRTSGAPVTRGARVRHHFPGWGGRDTPAKPARPLPVSRLAQSSAREAGGRAGLPQQRGVSPHESRSVHRGGRAAGVGSQSRPGGAGAGGGGVWAAAPSPEGGAVPVCGPSLPPQDGPGPGWVKEGCSPLPSDVGVAAPGWKAGEGCFQFTCGMARRTRCPSWWRGPSRRGRGHFGAGWELRGPRGPCLFLLCLLPPCLAHHVGVRQPPKRSPAHSSLFSGPCARPCV